MLALFLGPAPAPIPQTLHELGVVVRQILPLEEEMEGGTVFESWSGSHSHAYFPG